MAATSTLVSVEEYLATNYKPACEYVDGVLIPKPRASWKHGRVQNRSMRLIETAAPDLLAASEISVQVRTGKFLIPDVIVQEADRVQDPYPVEPVHLCIEILSPADRMSDALAKCEDYHAWGVNAAWLIDPEEQRAWEYRAGQRPVEVHRGGKLTTDRVSISVDELFSVLG